MFYRVYIIYMIAFLICFPIVFAACLLIYKLIMRPRKDRKDNLDKSVDSKDNDDK
ncbi:hypothetical protein [Microvirus mar18]|uniref:Uncharacterized protein n=1 Tax=Microvirus mar18 TaxID=2851150 RepID=A0A8F5MJ07_9VIRU|nr:hypothetical protein [Microvirus mar18]